jgi:hypothetical protein
MEAQARFTQRQIARYSKLAAAAVRHSVPLDEIIRETRRYHGDEFAVAVERCVQDFM